MNKSMHFCCIAGLLIQVTASTVYAAPTSISSIIQSSGLGTPAKTSIVPKSVSSVATPQKMVAKSVAVTRSAITVTGPSSVIGPNSGGATTSGIQGVSGTTITSGQTGGNTPASNNYFGVFGARPDFRYNPAGLNFKQQNTFTTGQINMGIGPGLTTGTVRYVPTGEI